LPGYPFGERPDRRAREPVTLFKPVGDVVNPTSALSKRHPLPGSRRTVMPVGIVNRRKMGDRRAGFEVAGEQQNVGRPFGSRAIPCGSRRLWRFRIEKTAEAFLGGVDEPRLTSNSGNRPGPRRRGPNQLLDNGASWGSDSPIVDSIPVGLFFFARCQVCLCKRALYFLQAAVFRHRVCGGSCSCIGRFSSQTRKDVSSFFLTFLPIEMRVGVR